jgi:hypothetical protein
VNVDTLRKRVRPTVVNVYTGTRLAYEVRGKEPREV